MLSQWKSSRPYGADACCSLFDTNCSGGFVDGSGWDGVYSRLRKDGYTVQAAHDGRAALEALAANQWSVVLLDLKMPGMDGLQVLEEAGANVLWTVHTEARRVELAPSGAGGPR